MRPAAGSPEQTALAETTRGLVEQHPGSRLAGLVEQRLAAYRRAVEGRPAR